MFKNVLCFLALCLLSVSGEDNIDAKSQAPPTVNDKETVKVEPTNISALYIGDLLRTKPKEVLETAGSVHRPMVYERNYSPAASVPGRSLNYKTHGGHEYSEADYVHPSTHGKANAPRTVRVIGHQGRSVPVNVMGHLLTLKPVRLVKADSLPRSGQKSHYEGDDCAKNNDRSYSSEEKPYSPEEQSYRRAKQVPGQDSEYRSHPGGYSEDSKPGSTYSDSDPTVFSYESKTYPSDANSKSISSGSYTQSKSTSTSRTINPSRPRQSGQVVPTHSHADYRARESEPSQGDQDYPIYKTKEPESERPASYSDNTGREYSHSGYEREHKPREHQYSKYPPATKKPRKRTQGEGTRYSTSEPKTQQYAPAYYEQEKDSYAPYAPASEPSYREQPKSGSKYQDDQYDDSRGQQPQRPSYYSDASPSYETEQQPSKSQLRKKHRSSQYERAPSDGSENSGYRSRDPEYSYPQEHQIQSSRGKKGSHQGTYERYPSQGSRAEPAPSPQSYESTHPTLRPSEEKQPSQYVYGATPHHQPSVKYGSSQKRQYRESSRPARSAKSATPEGRAHAAGVEPILLAGKESKPYLSRSVSQSGNDQNPSSRQTQGRQMSDLIEYQTAYKPFNSEYPASYANDPQHKPEEQRPFNSYDRPHSYGGPSHSQTQSHSGDRPQQYGPYDGDDDEDDSHEQAGTPIKKDKGHHYISNIEGYKDTYGSNEPLNIDEDFFKKYGISPTAKVIVASAKKPNMFVADGTRVKEGEYFGNSGPSNGYSGPSSGHSGPSDEYSGPSSSEHSGPSDGYSGPSSGHSGPSDGYSGPSSSGPSEEEGYQPEEGYKRDGYREDSYNESPEELGPPRQIPGSFRDLVDTNPKFLRKLPSLLKHEDGFFKMDGTEESFDDIEYPKEQKGYIVSQGPGGLVQQHGDGVSKIVFNFPNEESRAEASEMTRDETKQMVSLASEIIANVIKSES